MSKNDNVSGFGRPRSVKNEGKLVPECRYRKEAVLDVDTIIRSNEIIDNLVDIIKAKKKENPDLTGFNVRPYVKDGEWQILKAVYDSGIDIGMSEEGHVYTDIFDFLANPQYARKSKWLKSQEGLNHRDQSFSGEGSTTMNLKIIADSLGKKILEIVEANKDCAINILDIGIGDCGVWLHMFKRHPNLIGKVVLVGLDKAMNTIFKNRGSKHLELKKLLGDKCHLQEMDSSNVRELYSVIDKHKINIVFARTVIQHMTIGDGLAFLGLMIELTMNLIITDFEQTEHSMMSIFEGGAIYRNIPQMIDFILESGRSQWQNYEYEVLDEIADSQGKMSCIGFHSK